MNNTKLMDRVKPVPKKKKLTKKEIVEMDTQKHTFTASGNKNLIKLGTSFTVTKRYEYIKVIGKGAYGLVIAAYDKISGEKVAIKKVECNTNYLIGSKCIR